MKYLCLGYFDKTATDSLPPGEMDRLMAQECMPLMETLYKTGQVISDAGLGNESKTLRRVKGKVVITDGPFVESKEMLGAALLIEAKDFDEAMRLAALHPSTQVAAGESLGWRMEVHPVPYFKGF